MMEKHKWEEIKLPFFDLWFNTEMFLHFLIDRERNINETHFSGETSLMCASPQNNIPMAEFIIFKPEDRYRQADIDSGETEAMREIIRISQNTLKKNVALEYMYFHGVFIDQTSNRTLFLCILMKYMTNEQEKSQH